MYGFRSLMVSFAVVFALMFCVGASVQAAAVEERADLKGPNTNPSDCLGDVVGRTTIEHKGEDLAQIIVGDVLDKDKSDNSVTVTIRFRNGPPNATFNIEWVALDTPGVCKPKVNNKFLGQMTTNADGSGRARFHLPNGNPFPGQGVKIDACIPTGNPPGTCAIGDEVYTTLFTEVFPPAP